MNTLIKAGVLISALAVSACTNPNRFGEDSSTNLSPAGANVPVAPINPASDPATPQYFSQTIGDRVLFPVDQSTLTPTAMGILDGQAQWLLTNSDYLAVIEGHADEQGTREYNLALGARRSNAVREYLVSKGVPSNRIRTISYGKERPAAVCSAESCYAENRRSVTVISIGSLS